MKSGHWTRRGFVAGRKCSWRSRCWCRQRQWWQNQWRRPKLPTHLRTRAGIHQPVDDKQVSRSCRNLRLSLTSYFLYV